MKIKDLGVNCADAVRWSIHPEWIDGAASARVYFQFGYARLEVKNNRGEIIYDNFAA